MLLKSLTKQEPVTPNPLYGARGLFIWARPQAVLDFDFCTLIFDFENVFQAFSQNEPKFSRPNMRYQYQKPRNRCEK
jgi:hypothetical protein